MNEQDGKIQYMQGIFLSSTVWAKIDHKLLLHQDYVAQMSLNYTLSFSTDKKEVARSIGLAEIHFPTSPISPTMPQLDSIQTGKQSERVQDPSGTRRKSYL